MVWLLGITVAWAQDRLLWDFDTRTPLLSATYGTPQVGVPPDPWDGNAFIGALVPLPGYVFPNIATDTYGAFTLEDPATQTVTITHDTLRAEFLTDGPYLQWAGLWLTLDDGRRVGSGEDAVSFQWQTVDAVPLTAYCGEEATLGLWSASWDLFGDYGRVDVDDIAFSGNVCPAFDDADLDGACLRGVDLDGDGACFADGERDTGALDCDDARFGPACLGLTFDGVAAGTASFHASGAVPGETVRLVVATREGSTCPASLGGACLGLRSPRRVASAVADAAGSATLAFAVGAAPAQLYAQVVAERGANPADTSAVLPFAP